MSTNGHLEENRILAYWKELSHGLSSLRLLTKILDDLIVNKASDITEGENVNCPTHLLSSSDTSSPSLSKVDLSFLLISCERNTTFQLLKPIFNAYQKGLQPQQVEQYSPPMFS